MFKPQELQSKINFKNQPNTIEETDFPIHSLSKDLAQLSQDPNYDPSDFSQEQEQLINKQTQDQMTDKQKTSPFLNQSQPVEKTQQTKNQTIEDKKIVEKMPEPEDISISSTPLVQKTRFKITLIVLLAVLLIFALVFIIYYYKNSNNTSNNDTPNEATSAQGEEDEEGFSFPVEEASSKDTALENNTTTTKSQDDENKTEEEAEPIFSLDKPNFLIIEESEDREVSLKKYIQDMNSMERGDLVEFVPVDSSYNPISFKDFATLLKINLPDNITALIDNEKQFSFLLYNDKPVKLNLAIPIKNTSSISEEMKKWEPIMIQNLKSLILPEDNTSLAGDFGESTYAETLIRYKNISSDGSTAIDYFLKNKLLVLTTSKDATLSLLNNDSLLKN